MTYVGAIDGRRIFHQGWQTVKRRGRDHVHGWMFLSGLALCGVIFGSIIAGQLNHSDTVVLDNALVQLFQGINMHQLAPASSLFWQGFTSDAQLLLLIWLFGVSVIGMPLIAVVIFLRAFSVGFSVGFAVIQFGWKGLALASVAIFLHQVVTMAVFILAGAMAMKFSAGVWNRDFHPGGILIVRLVKYTLLFAACSLGLLMAAWFQAYVSPSVLTALFSLH